MKIFLSDDATLRQQIDAHLANAADDLFRFRLTDGERERFQKHAPNFLAAFTSGDGSWSRIAAAASIDSERLYSAKISNSGLSAAGSQTLDELLELRHLLARNAQRQAQCDALASGPAPTGSAPQWRDADGKPVAVYRPQDSFAKGTSGSAVDLGDVVRALVSGRGLQEVNAALAGGSVSTGGALVPSELAAQVIDRMRQASVVTQAGALTIPMPARALSFAKIDGDPTVSWAAEGASLSETGPTFAAVTLTAKTLRGWVKVSRELVEDGIGLGDALNAAFGGAMAVELDRVALVGSGSGQEPLGIGAASGAAPIVTMAANGAQLTSWDKVLDALEVLQTANAPVPTAMIYAPRTATTMAKWKDTTNQPLQVPPALAAVPRFVTTAMPITQSQGTANNASGIVMGDFKRMLIGVRSELQIIRAESISTNEVVLGFVLRADVAWQHAAAFVQLRGIIP